MPISLLTAWHLHPLRFLSTGAAAVCNAACDSTADSPPQKFCEVTLGKKELQAFQYAVKHHYWYVLCVCLALPPDSKKLSAKLPATQAARSWPKGYKANISTAAYN